MDGTVPSCLRCGRDGTVPSGSARRPSARSEENAHAHHRGDGPAALGRRRVPAGRAPGAGPRHERLRGPVGRGRDDGVPVRAARPPAAAGGPRGRPGVRPRLQRPPAPREVTAEVLHETAVPDVVVAEWQVDGTVVATGRPYRVAYVAVVTVKDGEITAYRDYWDPSGSPSTSATRTRRRPATERNSDG
ncbi:nuclear transport factor 2 family protein [Streptomyces sp. M19]